MNNNNLQFESRWKQLTRRSVLKKNLSDINAYRKNHTSLDEALLGIIQEKDQLSFPEERVLIMYAPVVVNEVLFESDNCICITLSA